MGAEASSDIEAASWLFENAVDVLLVLDTAGRIQTASPAWYRLTGWSEDQTLGREWLDFMHGDESDLIHAHVVLMDTQGHASCEHRVLAENGEWIWMRSRVKRMSDGRAMSVLQDITVEHRQVKDQIKAARVAELLGVNAGVYVWRFDPIGQVYDLNPLMDGRRRHDSNLRMPAAKFQAAIDPDDWARIQDAWEHSIETGEMAQTEYRQTFEGVGWRRMRSAWHGVNQMPGGLWELLGITQDITELVEARDAALEAVEVKRRFLANMGHEISTPMNGVLGVLHLVKADALSDRNRALVEDALDCGEALAQSLHDIVEFTSLESGALSLDPEPMELAHALDAVVGMMRPAAEARGLRLESEAPDAGWARLDPLRLRQILLNLVGNAVKFTLKGGVKVALTCQGSGEAQRVRIEVRDTGVGVPSEARAQLFDRFQQADSSATRRFGGLGLGLALTKALVDQMDGHIGFFSVEGEGTTFWVEIAAPACAPPLAEADDEARWLEGLRVLVVEDNPTNRLVAMRMLSDLGAEVDVAENGAEGVRQARGATYDLIFMDIQMPVMDGVQATREIRALPGSAGLTPIVATTANVLAHQIEIYRKSGMDGCVSKPISPGALLGEIARLAGRAG